jgi:hypothetical protein
MKNKLDFTVESSLELIQETYNDIVTQMNYATQIMKKMMPLMKEGVDMTLIGPVIKEQQKIINDCIEKKLTVAKLQTTITSKKPGANSDNFGSMKINQEEISMIDKLVKSNGSIDNMINYMNDKKVKE